MGKKKIYRALLDGATDGLTGSQLSDHVLQLFPNATSKKIVGAAALALSDIHLKDRNVLRVICALAIQHRTRPLIKNNGGKRPAAISRRRATPAPGHSSPTKD
ncbi:hypothetical protein ACN2CC_17725 [Mesorhizobium muleiense]|uniref:hypothetical protein n=1 Tax=Mesorhizobium TaxID=68287 RepID=UPI000FE73CB7|nr:hypothetical protein [Mesorhizobium sp.]RWN54073.1 MAG: hypothetical protein EOS00_29920 [Mesorhizobium sp.]